LIFFSLILFFSWLQAEKLCKEIKAYKYLECSAQDKEGVSEVLNAAASASKKKKSPFLPHWAAFAKRNQGIL